MFIFFSFFLALGSILWVILPNLSQRKSHIRKYIKHKSNNEAKINNKWKWKSLIITEFVYNTLALFFSFFHYKPIVQIQLTFLSECGLQLLKIVWVHTLVISKFHWRNTIIVERCVLVYTFIVIALSKICSILGKKIAMIDWIFFYC